MADRTSAWLFNRIFTTIDKHIKEPKTRARLAKEFWRELEEGSYDFDYYQMECDDVLKRLGLCRKVKEANDYGEFPMEYGP